MGELVLFEGNDKKDIFGLGDTPLFAGSEEECDIIIDSSYISKKHCMFAKSEGGFDIFDLNTSIGTYVNQEKVIKQTLTNGDVIDFGEHRLIYFEQSAEDAAAKGLDPLKMSGDSVKTVEGPKIEGPGDLFFTAEITDGSKKKTVERLTNPVYIVGSSPDCDIILKDKGISANHAVLHKTEFGLTCINVSNKKAIKLNDGPTELRTAISSGDSLQIGKFNITIRQED